MVLIISCNKDAFIYKVDLDGIVLIILKTSSGFLWARRIDLTRIPMVPWTLNPNCSATKRAEASSVKNVAAESFSKMAKASIFLHPGKKFDRASLVAHQPDISSAPLLWTIPTFLSRQGGAFLFPSKQSRIIRFLESPEAGRWI